MNVDSVRLPDQVEQSAVTSLLTSTAIVRGVSGNETRKSNFSNILRQFTIAYGPEYVDDVVALCATQLGPRFGFTFKDWLDYQVPDGKSLTVELLTQTVATGGTSCQLTKTYTFAGGARTRVRNITLPDPSTISVSVDGSPYNASGDWELLDDGVLLFPTIFPSGTEISWTGEFFVPVRFNADQLDIQLIVEGLSAIQQLVLMEIPAGSPA